MEFEQSALMFDVNQILNAGANPVHFSLSARIFVDATSQIVNPLKVTSVDLRRDYMNRFGDELIVAMEILAEQHAREIIDITLTRADDRSREHGRCGARSSQSAIAPR